MENQTISNIIEGVLNKMTVSYDSVEIVADDVSTIFVIHTDDAGMLIGNHGETLDALSYVVRRLVQRDLSETDERKSFILDVNNYQKKKLDEFKQNLNLSADRVRLFKQAVELSPMTSYERMIVHTTFSEDPEIMTESYGEGKFRRVVLKHRGSTPQIEEE